MKRASYKCLLLGGSLLIPAALVEASASGSPSGRDTTQVTAETISQTLDAPADLGFLEYLFKRKQTDDGEQAPVGADVPEAHNGPVEELGLMDLLLGKEPQPLVIAAAIPVAKKPVSEPVEDPLLKVGLINYLINRGNTSLRPAVGSAQAVNRSQPTHASAKSSISTSLVAAKYTTAFGPGVIREDLLRIKVVLGQLPRSALASVEPSNRGARTPKIENDAPVVENTDPQLDSTEKHDSPGSATAADVERIGLLELLLRRHPDAARVEATKTPSGDNNGN